MATLLFLVRNCGRVVSKDEILSAVWPDTFVSEVALARNIHQLRQALEDEIESPRYIETVHKKGYRLIAAVVWDEGGSARRRRLMYLGSAGAAFLLAALALTVWVLWRTRDEPARELSIAVLPFESLGSNPDDQYFADGITDEIITRLSGIRKLKVVSRTSCMLYRKPRKSLRAIADELGVSTVLEGTVRKAGGRLRITAQLIDAETDKHLWSNVYDREGTAAFEIQVEVATLIVSALGLELSPAEMEQLEARPTTSLSAYDFYLRGREYYRRYRERDNENAIALFKRARDLDPNFALAYAGLADCYGQKAYQFGYSSNWIESAIDMGLKAVALHPSSTEGHKALGLAYAIRGSYPEALQAYRTALKFSPNYHPAIGNTAVILEDQGKFAEAMGLCRRSLALNPRAPVSYFNVGDLYRDLHDLERAAKWYDSALELDPDYAPARYEKVWIHLCRKEYSEALDQSRRMLGTDTVRGLNSAGDAELVRGNAEQANRQYTQVLALSSRNWYAALRSSLILWRAGEQKRARELLEPFSRSMQDTLQRGSESSRIRRDMAALHAVRGEKETALKWLEEAARVGWRPRPADLIAPEFEALAGEKRFRNLIVKLKLDIEEQRRHVEEMEKKAGNSGTFPPFDPFLEFLESIQSSRGTATAAPPRRKSFTPTSISQINFCASVVAAAYRSLRWTIEKDGPVSTAIANPMKAKSAATEAQPWLTTLRTRYRLRKVRQ
jgi:protein kinase/serine/threonine-protein kinase